jgi:hypothetical protein
MYHKFRGAVRMSWALLAVAVWVSSLVSSAHAQFGFNFGNAVGGVRVDSQGVLSMAPDRLEAGLFQRLQAEVHANNRLFTDQDGLRKLSLGRLNQVVAEAVAADKTIPAEARFLGGLMRIEYVIVDSERNDLILAGPAEVLVANERGNVVGEKSGRPAIHLEDLITAMRTIDEATTGPGISVSIEPTEEARVAFRQITAAAKQVAARARQGVDASVLTRVEQAMGPQQVILTGVPNNSRFANVLVLADYRMKRISMGLDPSPLQQLPSFVSMLARSSIQKSITPRFWMEMDYEPLRRSEDGTVWQLSGTGVKTLSEEDFIAADGRVTGAGKGHPIATKWAETMTKHYGDLIDQDQVFAELRNLFDMSVIVALIEKENLAARSGVELETLLGHGQPVTMPVWDAPKQVPTTASLVNQSGSGAIITASGGVQLDPWSVVSHVTVDQDLGQLAGELAKSDGRSLLWN